MIRGLEVLGLFLESTHFGVLRSPHEKYLEKAIELNLGSIPQRVLLATN
jgi:hypothetical protein